MSERTYSVIFSRVRLDQSDELLATDRELLGVLTQILGDQLHDVVVVDDGGGEEYELAALRCTLPLSIE